MTTKTIIPILLLGLLICCNSRNTKIEGRNNKESKDTFDSSKSDTLKIKNKSLEPLPISKDSFFFMEGSLLVVTGIIQSSGIQQFDNFSFKAEYQVESLGRSFYLLTKMNLIKYWGKCVKIKGRLTKGWSLNMTDFSYKTFGRIPLEVNSISFIPCKSCKDSPYIDSKRISTLYHNSTLKGYISRTKRPIPDISMDYRITLDTPISNPEDKTIKINKMTIYPNIDLKTLNEIIENKLHITAFGWVTGGYDETIIFITDSITIN